jgi:hypothetical protein
MFWSCAVVRIWWDQELSLSFFAPLHFVRQELHWLCYYAGGSSGTHSQISRTKARNSHPTERYLKLD